MAIKIALYDSVRKGRYECRKESKLGYKSNIRACSEREQYRFTLAAHVIRGRTEALASLTFCESVDVSVVLSNGVASVTGEIVVRDVGTLTLLNEVVPLLERDAHALARESPGSSMEITLHVGGDILPVAE